MTDVGTTGRPVVRMPAELAAGPSVRVEQVPGIGFRQMSVVGDLTTDEAPALRQILSTVLTLYPRVVLDCARLRIPKSVLLSVFCTAHERAGGWPLSRLALYGLDEGSARWYRDAGLADRVPYRAGMAEAVAALDERPAVLRRGRLLLPPTLVPDARETVEGCWSDWSLPGDVAIRAALVAAELGLGAVEAGSVRARLAVEWRPGAVGLALTERLPAAGPVGPLTAVALDELAESWSSHPHQYGRRTIATIPL
ncbi:MAG TPA: hypothetical protein VGN37_03670 [Actinocatenispora sp.]